MTDVELIGDQVGIKLWYKLSTSTLPEEQQYFSDLCEAAQKHGKVWYSDLIKRIGSGANQPTYQMLWNNGKWEVSLFFNPDPTPVSKPKTYNIREDEIIPL